VVRRLFARIAAATGGTAWRFFARIAAAAATVGGVARSLSTRIVARTTGAAAAAGAAKAGFLTANPPGAGASDVSEGDGEGAGDSGEGVEAGGQNRGMADKNLP
jgi:hypothetical protein